MENSHVVSPNRATLMTRFAPCCDSVNGCSTELHCISMPEEKSVSLFLALCSLIVSFVVLSSFSFVVGPLVGLSQTPTPHCGDVQEHCRC
eukprot:m.108538 g.108538  ORF g.108538 m.108538 type:complete len:90 (-) comp13350_c2_seq1:995-1264(-)